MMRVTTEGGKLFCIAELKDRFGVYLDNDSLMDMAKGPAARRGRFVGALRTRGALLFSLTNAAEVAGPQGASASAVRAFLEAVGPYWVPLELNPWTVVKREEAGLGDRAPLSDGFMKAYPQQRVNDLSEGGRSVLDLSAENFFRLGAVVDWVQEDRDNIREEATEMDQTLRDKLRQLRVNYEKDPASLDRLLPPVSFKEQRRATFVLVHILRMLVLEAKAFQFTAHDALDLCHAVLGAAYGSLATLDKQWKRRVENLPKPNRLAKIYYRPKLDQLVDLLDLLVRAK